MVARGLRAARRVNDFDEREFLQADPDERRGCRHEATQRLARLLVRLRALVVDTDERHARLSL